MRAISCVVLFRKYIPLILILLYSPGTFAQARHNVQAQSPRPPFDLLQYFAKNLRYPDNKPIGTGKIVVKFIVNTDGSIGNIRVVQGMEMEKPVADLIRAMPKWEPGRRNGKPIKVDYTLPINLQ